MVKITTADFRKGKIIRFKNAPYQILSLDHKTHGRGMAHIQVKLKNVRSGVIQEHTYKSGEVVGELQVMTKHMQFLYKQGDQYYFMDNTSFEQISVDKKILADIEKFLKENQNYQLIVFENEVIGIKLPKKINLKVIDTQAGVKGDTVTGTTKLALLETNWKIQVPLFIRTGEVVSINTDTGKYVERARSQS